MSSWRYSISFAMRNSRLMKRWIWLAAAVFAVIVCFLATRLGFGLALPCGLTLLVLMTSIDIVDLSFLSRLEPELRATILGGLETVLPNLDAYDAGATLARRHGIGWLAAGELTLRGVVTVLAVGLLQAFWPSRRREA